MAEGVAAIEQWMEREWESLRRESLEQGEVIGLKQGELIGLTKGREEAMNVHRSSILEQIALKFETPVNGELLQQVNQCQSSERLHQIAIWLMQVDTLGELKAKLKQEF